MDSGTRAAAAGGYCAILAMPNTDPVVDSAPVLRSLRERARAEARIPTGFLAAITRGQRGRGAHRDGRARRGRRRRRSATTGCRCAPAGVLRQALQYQRLADRPLALHEEDPSLSADGRDARGRDLGAARARPASRRSPSPRWWRATASSPLYEGGRIHVQHVSARETVRAIERARELGTTVTCEATPHHLLLTDEAVRTLDTNMKMNPPLRAEADRQALIAALRSGVDRLRGHRPRAARARGEGAAVRARPDGRDRARDGVRRALHRAGALRGARARGARGAHDRGRRALRHRRRPSLAPGSPANVCLVDLASEWEVGEAGYESRSVELRVRRPPAHRAGSG